MERKMMFILLLVSVFVFNSPAFAEENVKDLKKQIEMLQKRVDELEASQSTNAGDPWGFFNQRSSAGWDPFAEMNRMQQHMDEMFQRSFIHQGNTGQGVFSSNISFGADVDLEETDQEYRIVFDMAGLDKDKVDIQINEHSITVKGEQSSQQQQENDNGFFHAQSFGTFMKTIPLPEDADTAKMKTEKANDQLVIHLPKKNS